MAKFSLSSLTYTVLLFSTLVLGQGTQFITGACTSDADCASGCCGFKSGKCAGAVVAQERDGGCGFGDSSPNDNAAVALGFTGTGAAGTGSGSADTSAGSSASTGSSDPSFLIIIFFLELGRQCRNPVHHRCLYQRRRLRFRMLWLQLWQMCRRRNCPRARWRLWLRRLFTKRQRCHCSWLHWCRRPRHLFQRFHR